MVTTVENKIKISFEFENLAELEKLYFALNTACVSISYREKHAGEFLSVASDTVNRFTEYFNPTLYKNAQPISQ